MSEPQVIKGISASDGIAIGKAFVLEQTDLIVGRWIVPPEAVKSEVTRFKKALESTRQEMMSMRQHLLKILGKSHARLLEAYLLILDDPLINKDVIKRISSQNVNAEYALSEAIEQAVRILEKAPDEYFRERRYDIVDVGKKILHYLLGRPKRVLSSLSEPSIIIAHNLIASDVLSFKPEMVIGIATDIGGKTSHTSILAQSLGIPAVVGLRDITTKVV